MLDLGRTGRGLLGRRFERRGFPSDGFARLLKLCFQRSGFLSGFTHGFGRGFLGRRFLLLRRRRRHRVNGLASDQLDRAPAAPDDIGLDAALHHLLVRLHLAHVLIFRRDHAIDHNSFFADRDLRLFHGGKRYLDSVDVRLLKGTLRLLATDPDLLELGDEILGLDIELLGQLMHSHFTHFPLH